MKKAVEKSTMAQSHSGCSFRFISMSTRGTVTSAGLFHLPPIPIDDVDGGGLSCETQKAERHGDGELPGAALEGRVEKPADERKIVAALPPNARARRRSGFTGLAGLASFSTGLLPSFSGESGLYRTLSVCRTLRDTCVKGMATLVKCHAARDGRPKVLS